MASVSQDLPIRSVFARCYSPDCRLLSALICCAFLATPARADEIYEREPINYFGAAARDPVARLQQALERGEAKLERNEANGYLSSLLEQLKIPASSQTLVFTKTSFQRDRITPANPRALYFDDDTYVGWVPGGDVLELASTDPELGTVFYTLDQRKPEARIEAGGPKEQSPQLVRQNASCLQCHGSSMTRDVPGLLLRSVYSDASGQPVLSAGTFLTTQESPFAQRWGGWYVTGSHGRQRHMGNVFVGGAGASGVANSGLAGSGGGGSDGRASSDSPDLIDADAGANVTDLSGKFDVSAYPRPGSDVVALMVLAHQAQMHNLLTRANYQTRLALRDEAAMNESLGRSGGGHSQTTLSRVKDAGEPLVRYMLFCDEAPLGKVEGSGEFDRDFEARGPRDRQGRSLRELDLKRRMFKYPLSYLIYSEQFDALPGPVKDYVYRRLWDVLNGRGDGGGDGADFSHLSGATGAAIIEILRDTKKGLPAYWGSPK